MRRIYYGWFIVAASMLIYMLIIGSTFSVFGLFVQPVSEEFGLSRADMNTGLILLNLGNAALAPFIGRILDRIAAKKVMLASTLLIGGSLAALGASDSILVSSIVMAVPLAAGLLGAGTMTLSVLLVRWFVVYRGRAMTLSVIGLSLGGIVVAPVVGWLIESEGWRAALFALGGTITVLMLCISFVIRERPGPDDIESASAPPAPGQPAAAPAGHQGGPPIMSILRMPQFWTIAIGVALGLAAPQAVMISVVPLALEEGLSMMQAASLVSVAGGAAIAGKLLLAFVADRLDRTLLLAALFALTALPCTALLFSDGYGLLLASAAVLGVTTGALAPIYYALLADRFGLASFGTVRGMIVPITAIIGAVGVRFIGEVFDRTGRYDFGFGAFAAISLIAAGLLLATRYMRPVPSATGPSGASVA